MLRSGSLRFQRPDAFNWFNFYFKQGQGQGKESAKPRLSYSNKAKAKGKAWSSFYLQRKNQSQCKVPFNLFKPNLNISQRKVWFDLFKQNQSKRKISKKKDNLNVCAQLQLAVCHYAIKSFNSPFVSLAVSIDTSCGCRKSGMLKTSSSCYFSSCEFCFYVLFCIVFLFFVIVLFVCLFCLVSLFVLFFFFGGRVGVQQEKSIFLTKIAHLKLSL